MVKWVHEHSSVEVVVEDNGGAEVLDVDESKVGHESDGSDDEENDVEQDLRADVFVDGQHNWKSQGELDVAWHEPSPWEALVIVVGWVDVVNPEQVGPPKLGARGSQGLEVLPNGASTNVRHDVNDSK